MTKFVSPRARFTGTLGGIRVDELKGLDYGLMTIDERMEEVKTKVEQTKPFFDEYFFQKEKDERDNGEFDNIVTDNDIREFYRYSPNTTDELAEDINICKYLESYASYLLNSKDLPKEKQQEYKILTEERFKKILQREKASSNVSTEEDSETEGFSMEQLILDTRPSNDYVNLDLVITKKDLDVTKQNNAYGIREKDAYLASVLNDYNTLQEFLRNEMQKVKNGEQSRFALFKLVNLMSEIKKDMLLSKTQILGVRCKAKRLGDESPYNDFSELDYENEKHIKACLKFCTLTNTPRPDDMVSHIGYDLNNAINELYKNKKIDKIDCTIISYYNSNYTFESIGKIVHMSKVAVSKRLDKICKKITEVI